MTKYTSIYSDEEIAKMTGAIPKIPTYKKPEVNPHVDDETKLHQKDFENRLLKIKCPLCKNPSVSACLCGHYSCKFGHTYSEDGKEFFEKHPEGNRNLKPINSMNYR